MANLIIRKLLTVCFLAAFLRKLTAIHLATFCSSLYYIILDFPYALFSPALLR
jgi:hypothetical protein